MRKLIVALIVVGAVSMTTTEVSAQNSCACVTAQVCTTTGCLEDARADVLFGKNANEHTIGFTIHGDGTHVRIEQRKNCSTCKHKYPLRNWEGTPISVDATTGTRVDRVYGKVGETVDYVYRLCPKQFAVIRVTKKAPPPTLDEEIAALKAEATKAEAAAKAAKDKAEQKRLTAIAEKKAEALRLKEEAAAAAKKAKKMADEAEAEESGLTPGEKLERDLSEAESASKEAKSKFEAEQRRLSALRRAKLERAEQARERAEAEALLAKAKAEQAAAEVEGLEHELGASYSNGGFGGDLTLNVGGVFGHFGGGFGGSLSGGWYVVPNPDVVDVEVGLAVRWFRHSMSVLDSPIANVDTDCDNFSAGARAMIVLRLHEQWMLKLGATQVGGGGRLEGATDSRNHQFSGQFVLAGGGQVIWRPGNGPLSWQILNAEILWLRGPTREIGGDNNPDSAQGWISTGLTLYL